MNILYTIVYILSIFGKVIRSNPLAQFEPADFVLRDHSLNKIANLLISVNSI